MGEHELKRRRAEIDTVALQFVLAHPLVASVIPGLASPDEVRQTAAWARAPIPAALWSDLKAEQLLDAEAPVPADGAPAEMPA